MSHYKGDETTGFQSPAQDHIEPVIDLAAILDLRRPGRYPVRVVGQALRERGILHGDVLIANAAADPKAGQVCIAIVNNEVIVATLGFRDGEWWAAAVAQAAGPCRSGHRNLGDRRGAFAPARIIECSV